MRAITPEEIKQLQLDIMSAFHAYCEANGLNYHLTYGSLLGAVRHNGFIPWDDDIDVAMPRKDYEKLLVGFNQGRGDTLRLVSLATDEAYVLPFAKIYDTRTLLVEKVDHPFEMGVNIDIFPLDNMSDDYASAASLFRKTDVIRNALILKDVSLDSGRSILKNGILVMGKVLTAPFSMHGMVEKLDSMCRKYEGDTLTRFVCLATAETYGIKEVVESKWLCECQLHPFEDRAFYIPTGYDAILTHMYGDYMTPPPADKQITHHANNVFWRD